jgi:hypothetical protein
MTEYNRTDRPSATPRLTREDSDRRRRRRWKRRLKTRAAAIKKQLQTEDRFHKAMQEIHTTDDQSRRSYLNWILYQMFSLFDYESGLHAINDKAAYNSWLTDNKQNPRQTF